MIFKLEELNVDETLTVDDLLKVLKREATNIHIKDIMMACNFLIEEGKYVQSSYREKFYNAYLKGFILRIKEVKEDKNINKNPVNLKDLEDSLIILEEQEIKMKETYPHDPNFSKIYQIISIYTTFILDEPIHVVGTEFPGGFKVKVENGTYYCPVKEKQKDNPDAVCGICIAEQDPEVG
jgi:uncharacterized protein (UPF0305 family)